MSVREIANRWATPITWVAIAVIAIALLLTLRLLPIGRALDALGVWIDGLGLWGIAVFAGIYVVSTVLLLPGSALTLAAGAIFGLLEGVVAASIGATIGAACAFLVARYVARAKVAAMAARRPKFGAVDRAISEGGWKIVALLRLSPAIPFNLQNYLYGLTAIRFGPYVAASWLFMLPGAFLYVYLGHLGSAGLRAGTAGGGTDELQWLFRILGLLATIAVTWYVTRLARRALAKQTEIEVAVPDADETTPARASGGRSAWPWKATIAVLVALLSIAGATYAQLNAAELKGLLSGLFGPPRVEMQESYAELPDGPSFDHSDFDALLGQYVDESGLVDYGGLAEESQRLDAYLTRLAQAPFAELGRDEKLALLINAYNAFTLRLILDHYPLESIRDIPSDQRWEAERWSVGGRTWSLDQLEHEQIRPNFVEPRVHFALVCAAIGCPVLRNEAYVAARLEAQLAAQAEYVHTHERWVDYADGAEDIGLTMLYNWYADDFTQTAGSVLAYVADYLPTLRAALDAGHEPDVDWLDYDWSLNDQAAFDR